MMPSSLLLLGASLSVGAALPLWGLSMPTLPVLYAAGFQNPSVSLTQGGAGTCISGTIPVAASAQNVQMNFPIPANQSVITETLIEYLQVSTTLPGQVIGAATTVSGTYNIAAKLCYPALAMRPGSSIQFLTHGVGFDKSYWDFYSSDYSYQNAAALAGYTTFSYDRLGIGSSDHPDPIQVVQAPLQIAIAHALIQKLRSGSIASTKFTKIAGVGHSLGSELTNAITAQYPSDLDTAVLTGFSVDGSGIPVFFSSLNLVIANQNSPARFSNLNNGYLISQSSASNQFAFFRAPNYAPAILIAAEASKQTFTIGELFTNSMFVSPASSFTGAVDVVIGENDLPFCQSNCLVPRNKMAEVVPALYPAAKSSSTTYMAKGVGHGINAHFGAGAAYAQIFGFLNGEGY